MTAPLRLSAGLVCLAATVAPRIAAQCAGGLSIDTLVIESGGVASGGLAASLHVTTRPGVIRNTVVIRPGDCFDPLRIAESERALWHLGVFRAVKVDTVRVAPDRLALHVVAADGWSSRPVADYTRAGANHSWAIGLMDRNFLGSATRLLATYGSTPDRSTLAFEFADPHFLMPHVTLWLRHAQVSNGRESAWNVGVPFRASAARTGASIGGEIVDERALLYGEHTAVLDSRITAVRVRANGGYAVRASSSGYVRVWAGAVWRREGSSASATAPLVQQDFTALGTGLEIAHGQYRQTHGLNAYGRREWIDVSELLRLGVWAAPRALGYDAGRAGTGFEATAQVGAGSPVGYVVWRASATALYAAHGLDSGQVRTSVTVVAQPSRRQTVIVYGDAGIRGGHNPPGYYDLWLEGRGPRLFAPHGFIGARMGWLVVEDRVLLADSVLARQLALGLAPFVEYARATQPGAGESLGGDAGLALRIVPLRLATAEVLELAVGYRFGAAMRGERWALGIRSGVSF